MIKKCNQKWILRHFNFFFEMIFEMVNNTHFGFYYDENIPLI